MAGLASGAGLSVTHGTIARSANPHRLFALVGIALGVFAISFFAVVPPLLASAGGPALFRVFAAVMALAALVAALAFPQADGAAARGVSPVPPAPPVQVGGGHAPLPPAVWFGIVGIGCMGLVQAMTFAFLERVGTERGFLSSKFSTPSTSVGGTESRDSRA